ncbi:hypothetical protein JCM14036_08200 [Desulfotomaculum defluvii]
MIKNSKKVFTFTESRSWCDCDMVDFTEWTYEGRLKFFRVGFDEISARYKVRMYVSTLFEWVFMTNLGGTAGFYSCP